MLQGTLRCMHPEDVLNLWFFCSLKVIFLNVVFLPFILCGVLWAFWIMAWCLTLIWRKFSVIMFQIFLVTFSSPSDISSMHILIFCSCPTVFSLFFFLFFFSLFFLIFAFLWRYLLRYPQAQRFFPQPHPVH